MKDKFKIIDEQDIPNKRSNSTQWEKLFSSVPIGKALVIPVENMKVSAIRSALIYKQQQGKYTNLKVRYRGKQKTIYLINPTMEKST